jgi:hypothetical protein
MTCPSGGGRGQAGACGDPRGAGGVGEGAGAAPARGGPAPASGPGGSGCQADRPPPAGGTWSGVEEAWHGGVVSPGGRRALR